MATRTPTTPCGRCGPGNATNAKRNELPNTQRKRNALPNTQTQLLTTLAWHAASHKQTLSLPKKLCSVVKAVARLASATGSASAPRGVSTALTASTGHDAAQLEDEGNPSQVALQYTSALVPALHTGLNQCVRVELNNRGRGRVCSLWRCRFYAFVFMPVYLVVHVGIICVCLCLAYVLHTPHHITHIHTHSTETEETKRDTDTQLPTRTRHIDTYNMIILTYTRHTNTQHKHRLYHVHMVCASSLCDCVCDVRYVVRVCVRTCVLCVCVPLCLCVCVFVVCFAWSVLVCLCVWLLALVCSTKLCGLLAP